MEKKPTMLCWIWVTSHDGAGVGVFVAEGGGVPLLHGACPDERRLVGIVEHVAHVPRRRLLVVGPRRVGVRHHLVRHVRPRLRLLPRPPPQPLHHLRRLHLPRHRHLVLLRVHLHAAHACGHAGERPTARLISCSAVDDD